MMRKGLALFLTLSACICMTISGVSMDVHAQGQENIMAEEQKENKKITIYNAEEKKEQIVERIVKSNDEWKKELKPGVFHITREQGTEPPFTGKLNFNKDSGIYECAVCGNDLFVSENKFNSGTGWPSFTNAVNSKNVGLKEDSSLGMSRVEVICARCDSHLGHVFDDGPAPTGKRFCINSAALKFKHQKDEKKD